jgi:hypothetical protein
LEDDERTVPLTLPRSRFHEAALSVLRAAAGGLEVTELVEAPHWLASAVALFRALTGVGSVTEKVKVEVEVEVKDGVVTSVKKESWDHMVEVVRSCVGGALWGCGRAHAAVVGTLVDAGAAVEGDGVLAHAARWAFRGAGRVFAPHAPSAFTLADAFQATLVRQVLAETGAIGLRGRADSRATTGIDDPENSREKMPEPGELGEGWGGWGGVGWGGWEEV